MGIETLNEDLELNIPMFDDDMDIIAKLDDEPNAVGGLSAAELKAEFDRPGKTIQEYLNKTLIPSLIGTVAEESVRAQNEYVRVTNENQRIANEEAREKAEQAREDKTSGIVAQATEQAKKAEEQAKLAGQVKSMQAEAETLPAGSEATAKTEEENGRLVLKLGLPRGETGPRGKEGPPGPRGEPGNVDFEALTPEQMEMLKGDPGEPGPPGASPNISILPGERDEADGTVRYGTVIEVTNPDGSKVYAFVPDGRDGGPGPAGADGKTGSAGKDGVTFTPSVSSAGVLSWTNDGGKQNPSSVNIKGPAGPAGEPGDTPYIGANGNWWIGGTDTGVAATGSGSGGASVQADWGENDETKLSHVKGRTHWKEEFPGKDIILETTKTFGGSTILSAAKGSLEDGEEYIVTWNGKEYACVCHGNYVGNKSLTSGGGDNTGEPFCISNTSGTLYQIIKANSASESITFGVKEPTKVTYHKLDPGYLPEGVPYTEESVVELLSASGEVDPGVGGFMTQTTIDVAIGDTLIVKYNGTEYECKTVDGRSIDPSSEPGSWGAGNLGLMMGTGDSGEPFVLVGTQGVLMIVPLDGSASVSVVLSKYVEFAYEVPQSCLPDYLPRIENIGGVILPETTVTEADSEGAYFDVTGATVKWESGVYYDITLNGKTYRCVVSPNAVDSENLWIREYVADKTGNLALCPFVARFWELNDTAFFVFGGLNVGDTVKIEGPIIYHKMSRLLMPTGSEPLSIYLGYAPSGDIHSINVTETELEQAISDHRQIILYFSYNGSSDLRAYTFAEYSTEVRFTSVVITSDSVAWCYGIEIESFNGDGTVTVTEYRKSI